MLIKLPRSPHTWSKNNLPELRGAEDIFPLDHTLLKTLAEGLSHLYVGTVQELVASPSRFGQPRSVEGYCEYDYSFCSEAVVSYSGL